jgi:hypothetical protein
MGCRLTVQIAAAARIRSDILKRTGREPTIAAVRGEAIRNRLGRECPYRMDGFSFLLCRTQRPLTRIGQSGMNTSLGRRMEVGL